MISQKSTQVEEMDFNSPVFLEKCYERLYQIENEVQFSTSSLYQTDCELTQRTLEKKSDQVSFLHSGHPQNSTDCSEVQSQLSRVAELENEKEIYPCSSQLASEVHEYMAHRVLPRLDEILKFVIRKILKNLRHKFQVFFSEITGHSSFRTSDPEALRPILQDFISLHYGIKMNSQLSTAEGIFYNYKVKAQQGRVKEFELVSRGTKKGALDFFHIPIARSIIFPQFKYLLAEAHKRAKSSLKDQITNLLNSIKSLARDVTPEV